jgi:hypothetical protein
VTAGSRPTMALSVLCAGAAKAVVAAVETSFAAETGATIDGTYGAVGDRKSVV